MAEKEPTKGVMTRLPANEDSELLEWMERFAERGRQGDLIRAALYVASGLPMPDSLRYIVADLPGAQKSDDQALVKVGTRIAEALERQPLFIPMPETPKKADGQRVM